MSGWMSLLRRVGPRQLSRVTRLAACTALVGVALAGCSEIGGAPGAVGSIEDVAQRAVPEAVEPALTMNPPDGAAGVAPSERVTAVVASGQLSKVELRSTDGDKLDGVLSPDGERWTSSGALHPDKSYVLTTVTRSGTGEQATSTSRFSTQSPGQQVSGKITPASGSTVEKDRPVAIEFDKAITDHGAVERSLRVTSNPTVRGSSHWEGDRKLVWQPDEAWPDGGEITASLDFYGRAVGGNLFGAADLRSVFRVAGAGGDDRDLAVAARDGVPDLAVRPSGAPQASPRPSQSSVQSTPKPAATPRSSAPAARSRTSSGPSRSTSASSSADETTTRSSKPTRRSSSQTTTQKGPTALLR